MVESTINGINGLFLQKMVEKATEEAPLLKSAARSAYTLMSALTTRPVHRERSLNATFRKIGGGRTKLKSCQTRIGKSNKARTIELSDPSKLACDANYKIAEV